MKIEYRIRKLIVRWKHRNRRAPYKGKNVWIVGRETARLDGHPDYFTWDFLGVYDDYDLALEKCITKRHFLFGAPLNHAEGEIDRGWQKKMLHLTREIKQRVDTPW